MIQTYAYKDIKIDEIFSREEEKTTVADVVANIIADVRKNGDEALKRYAREFDGAAAEVLEISAEERAAALAEVDAEFIEILKEAAAHIRAFHEKQKRTDFVITERPGVILGPFGPGRSVCPRRHSQLSLYCFDGLYSCKNRRGKGGLHGDPCQGRQVES